ncbi:hypothetical protein ABBQ32_005099, partial [Trebouxia sp. C0010 RCD-2024]
AWAPHTDLLSTTAGCMSALPTEGLQGLKISSWTELTVKAGAVLQSSCGLSCFEDLVSPPSQHFRWQGIIALHMPSRRG